MKVCDSVAAASAAASMGRLAVRTVTLPAAACLLALVLAPHVFAIDLLSGFGGPRDYGTAPMFRNDDDSSELITLPFSVNFFGNLYDGLYVNNNGNVSFNEQVWSFTPEPFPISDQPMIAPYWSDVDTRSDPGDSSNQVWVAAPNADTFVVTWDRVGYYRQNLDKVNDYQLVLRNRAADTGVVGDFDIEFRFNVLQWTTGDASDGTGGLGGIPAQAGFDAGNNVDYQVLPGSFTDSVLNLQNTSNVSAATPGLWTFAVRSGDLPGATPANPLLPVVIDESFMFEFAVTLPDQRVFIDPLVAIGYDYEVLSGPNVRTVLLPSVGDDLFDIWVLDEFSQMVLLQADHPAGGVFDFGPDGVNFFRVLGIEMSAGLDPSDPTAFVTGLTFTGVGVINMTQTPIAVPEPSTLVLACLGIAVLAKARRRRAHARSEALRS
jgi:hypothetical protein